MPAKKGSGPDVQDGSSAHGLCRKTANRFPERNTIRLRLAATVAVTESEGRVRRPWGARKGPDPALSQSRQTELELAVSRGQKIAA